MAPVAKRPLSLCNDLTQTCCRSRYSTILLMQPSDSNLAATTTLRRSLHLLHSMSGVGGQHCISSWGYKGRDTNDIMWKGKSRGDIIWPHRCVTSRKRRWFRIRFFTKFIVLNKGIFITIKTKEHLFCCWTCTILFLMVGTFDCKEINKSLHTF